MGARLSVYSLKAGISFFFLTDTNGLILPVSWPNRHGNA